MGECRLPCGMDVGRKELNWQAICSGRDLLKEISDLKLDARMEFEKDLRIRIADEILNPKEFKFKTGCAGDSLD